MSDDLLKFDIVAHLVGDQDGTTLAYTLLSIAKVGAHQSSYCIRHIRHLATPPPTGFMLMPSKHMVTRKSIQVHDDYPNDSGHSDPPALNTPLDCLDSAYYDYTTLWQEIGHDLSNS